MRFGTLRRAIEGISARVLTERLRSLEEARFVYREYKPTIPPEVTYGLTARMGEFQKVLCDIERLAQKWHAEDEAGAAKPPAQPAKRQRRRTAR
jgi:DNA-binding HxlR family transcriptional regulator